MELLGFFYRVEVVGNDSRESISRTKVMEFAHT